MGDAVSQTTSGAGGGGGEPTSEAEKPATEAEGSSAEGPATEAEAEKPAAEAETEAEAATGPTTEAEGAATDPESPTTEAEGPTTDPESPTTEAEGPTTEGATTDPESPTTGTEASTSGAALPGAALPGAALPGPGARADAEAAIVGPRTESGTWRAAAADEPSRADTKPKTISGEWALPPPESPNPLVRWFKRQPLFALTLVGLALGTPFLFNHFWLGYQRASLLGGLAQWEVRLAERGLPLPYYRAEAPPAPVGLPQEEARYQKVGLLSQFRGVRGWSGLLAGDPLPAATKEPGPLESAVLACRALRDAAEGNRKALPRARSLLDAAPEPYRPTLEVVHDYLSGQVRRAATQAKNLLGSATLPPACKPGLEAILREANRVRLARLLDQRPVTRTALEELKQWAGQGLLDALRADEDLADFLAPGEGDLRRAHAMLDLLDAEHVGQLYRLFPHKDPAGSADPGPAPPRSPLNTLVAPLQSIVARHLREPQSTEEEWAHLQRLILRFPRHGLFVDEGLESWREQLQAAVDQPSELLALTLRLCEVGYLPVGFEDILASHYLARQGAVPEDPQTPGEWLAVLVLESLEQPLVLERVEAAWRGLGRALDAVVVKVPGDRPETPLDQRELVKLEDLPTPPPGDDRLEESFLRDDALQRRQRALGAFVLARARLQAGEDPSEALQVARDNRYDPQPALLALELRAKQGAEALAAARERVEALQAHAEAVAGGDPSREEWRELTAEERLGWELRGWLVDRRVLDPHRADALVDLAELEAASAPKQAMQHVERALAIKDQHARGIFLKAKLLAASGDKKGARQEILRAFRAAAPTDAELRKELRAFLAEIGPN